MGLMDLPKLAMKAKKMQAQMKGTRVAGKYKIVAVVIDGTYSIVDDEVDVEELTKQFPEVEAKLLERIAKAVLKDASKALDDAKNALQQEISSSMDMDDIKNMIN
jgi:DNA-binding protein YbaB